MRKYIISIIAIAFSVLSVYAQTVSVDDVTIKAGETTVLSINLYNTKPNIVSFQMDLTLPAGITLNKSGCELSSRFTDSSQNLTIGKLANGDYRLTSTSMSLKPISGYTGEIIKLPLSASASAKGGTASIKNIRFATSNSEKMTSADVSFKVNVSYTLTYKVDGEKYKTSEVVYGTTITPETVPTKEGHTFSGWSEIPKTMPNRDVTVTGSFSINSYTLTYKVDGKNYKTSTVVYGTTITPEATPTKEGYTFSGWSEIPKTMPAHDVTVTGSFTINSYTLTYKVDGKVYKTSTVFYGTAITPEAKPTKEGYTFSGWSEIPATMPAHDVEVKGSFSINSYTLTYKVDGKEYKTMTVVYGTSLTPEAEPTKEGYTFSGWSEIPPTMPDHDVEVTGSFTINKYKLKYIVDGIEYKSYEINYSSTITPEAEPTKEGYTFSGWSEIPKTMPNHDVEVTGSFSINSYTLTYKVDGNEYKTMTIVYGTTLTPETEPKKEGYTFSGWSEIPSTMPAHNVVVTGSFSINSYTLTYMLDGKEYKTMTVVYGTPLTPEAELKKEGYTFSGWSEIPSTMPAHDVTVTGALIPDNYTLTYLVDGEKYMSTIVAFGTAIIPEVEPTKEGYTFSGWSEIPATMPNHDVEVTGTFKINSYTLTYKVDNEIYKTSTVVYGTMLELEAEPTKKGYTFSGWNGLPTTMPDHDVVVSGSFIINKYKLTYKVDGEVYREYQVDYNSEIIPEGSPEKEGYTFSGWSWIPKKMPAEDVTVTGTFTPIIYKLTYKVDGEVYKTYDVAFNSEITPEPEPQKEGYTFSGWSWIPKQMVAEDITVTGSFIPNSYTITYMIDDEIYKTTTVVYGTTITPEPVPNKEGYTFSGWSEIPATMPFWDVTVKGSFIVNSYTVTFMDGDKVLYTEKVNYGEAIPIPEIKDKYGLVYKWLDVPETMPAHDVVIQVDETDMIKSLTPALSKGEGSIYDLKGRKLASHQKGINIIRMSDGTSRKVLVK